MITDILFDLGGVLIDLDTQAMMQVCGKYGIDPQLFFVKARLDSPSTVCQGVAASDLITDYQVGGISTEQLIEKALALCPHGTTAERLIEAWNACLGTIPIERLRLIKGLREKGYRTHLLSNTNDLHWRYIEARYFRQEGYTCADLFDHLFLSHEVHLAKPDRAIYRHVIDTLGVPAKQLLFVDDAEANTHAAAELGIQTCWLDLEKEDILKCKFINE